MNAEQREDRPGRDRRDRLRLLGPQPHPQLLREPARAVTAVADAATASASRRSAGAARAPSDAPTTRRAARRPRGRGGGDRHAGLHPLRARPGGARGGQARAGREAAGRRPPTEADELIALAAARRPRPDGRPHLRLHRRGPQDHASCSTRARSASSTTSTPSGSTSACSSTTSTSSGTWPPHDLVDRRPPAGTRAGRDRGLGRAALRPGIEDIAYVNVDYDDDFIAHCHVNWLSPVKIRQTLIGGSERMLVWNDLDPDEKIKVYDRGIDLPERRPAATATTRRSSSTGSATAGSPARAPRGARLEVDHFLDCIAGRRPRRSPTASSGARSSACLEAMLRLAARGRSGRSRSGEPVA